MGFVSYGISGLLSTMTVFGIAITVHEHQPFSGEVIELRSGDRDRIGVGAGFDEDSAAQLKTTGQTRPYRGDGSVVELVSGDSGGGQKRQKIKINLQVERPEDLQVEEGDRVLSGQILADQTSTRRALEQQRQQLLISMDQLAVPMSPIPELPPPDFGVEEVAIVAAKAGMTMMDDAPTRHSRFIDPMYSDALDNDVREWNWEVKVKQVESRVELNRAIANLQRAESAYSWQRYQHGLNLQRQQETRQRQQFQVASLQADLWGVDQKLQELSVVRSPYSGVVQRLRVLGQEGRMLRVELVLVVKDEAE